ncbi:hypothetical protein QOZ80_2BG0158140 [Eleusine coracana subsp. coracana]|nr:hypothetical protein QOZ80_2BG0158140 [Eleusine coracana subsp. coracana]
MGLKLSCIRRRISLSRQVSLSPAPARVIAADGSLNEVHGASASDVLGDAAASPPLSFVCNLDALYFNESPPALPPGEPLRPGQIYFVLPAAMLGRPLSSADMAELAVRASSALASGSKPRQRRGRGRNGSKNKTKVRVMPVLSGDAEHEDVDFVNEKLNEQTLGQFGVLPMSPARTSSNQKLAATEAPSGLKRALSVIREDAM